MSDRYEMVLHFGKYNGRTIEEIPSNYLTWLMDECECGDDMKEAAQSELEFRTGWGNHFYEYE